MEVGRSEVQDYTWLHSELKVYKTLPHEETKKKKERQDHRGGKGAKNVTFMYKNS